MCWGCRVPLKSCWGSGWLFQISKFLLFTYFSCRCHQIPEKSNLRNEGLSPSVRKACWQMCGTPGLVSTVREKRKDRERGQTIQPPGLLQRLAFSAKAPLLLAFTTFGKQCFQLSMESLQTHETIMVFPIQTTPS